MAPHGLRDRRTRLVREWGRLVDGDGSPVRPRDPDLRAEIAASWDRSRIVVDPHRDCAPADLDAAERWHTSALAGPVGEMAGELRSIADDAGFVAAVTDAEGTILWTYGGRVMRHRAERVNFAPGGRWDETAMGTNAPALALRDRRPATVFSAEHLVEALHGWVCYAAPLRAPDGRVLGVLDLSSTWDRAHPMVMPTVRTLVAGIEDRLARLPPTVLSPALSAPRVVLECLGGGRVVRDGAALPLRPRQLEILALLALEPDGFTPDRLREALHGDRHVSVSSLKAQVSHLRSALGGALAQRHYVLTEPVSCDASTVLDALARGDTATAVQRYTGPLLPESEAPGIVRWRDYLEVAVRKAVLASPAPEHALEYGDRHRHDLEIHQHAHRLLAPSDGRRGITAARIDAALRA
ncbi:GAF domain-containing protein [Actinomadura rudentiformis]|uniref:Transcriptional regulator n=1 Tax=Actinomadura rudentiformis TaxID=359158 RepID=A0A6H9YKT8_9ACTN|nr:GAF domain-containing protein [Actinomadura rudentiformis]KAB2346967.1 transcriptional regulator [Actinomadura rudentiformis]